MSELSQGFRVLDVATDVVNELHSKGKVEVWDKRLAFYPNQYLELRDVAAEKHTVLGKVLASGETIKKVESRRVYDLTPRNREQIFALDALMDDSITTVVLAGVAGTGKTLLTLAMAMEKIESKKYKKVILTRPMSEVGKYKLGALPGDINEKFGPYLLNYLTNLEEFTGEEQYVQDLLEQNRFQIVPLQLMRGASFNGCLVIADEVQICDHMEILTIGTRIGEGSKVILMGDLNQRDEKIAREKTGLYKLMNDKKVRESPLVATIELTRCERSATAKLFAEVFEE